MRVRLQDLKLGLGLELMPGPMLELIGRRHDVGYVVVGREWVLVGLFLAELELELDLGGG